MTVNQEFPNSSHTLNRRLDVDFALQAAGLGVWELDPVTKTVNWDDRCRELFGLAKDNRLPYEQAIQYIHPDDVTRVDEAVQQALSPHSDGQYDVTYRTIGADDGLLRWVRFMGRSYLNATNGVYRFSGVAQDVTEQVLIQQKVAEVEARSRTIITHLPSATVVFRGRELVVETPSQNFIDIIDRGPDVEGKPLGELMPELESQSFLTILDEVYTSGQPFRAYGTPINIRQSDGSVTRDFFDLIYTPLFDANGQTYAILSVATNVTDVIKSHQQLKINEASLLNAMDRLQLALDAGRLGSYDLDLATGEMTCTPQCKANYGLKPTDELSFDRLLSLIVADDQAGMQQAVALSLDTHTPYSAEYRIYVNQGTRWIRAAGNPVYDEQGNPVKMVGITLDITEQKNFTEELSRLVQQRTEELAATNEELLAKNEELISANRAMESANSDLVRSNKNLEQFAYVASHDLQEPLRKIQQFGDLLKAYMVESSGEGLIYLNRMQSAATRMSTLIRDLLAFSRISTAQVASELVSLNQVISQVMDNLSVTIEETRAQIQVDDLPTIQGSNTQLGQLFMNLLSNAIKFSRQNVSGAMVTPRISVRACQVASTSLPDSVKPGRYAETYHLIEVIDNGIGFDEKYLDRIFQVFQRLHGKNEFAGTGVGLAIVEKVVANHGGAITANSRPGKGTTFNVYLPA